MKKFAVVAVTLVTGILIGSLLVGTAFAATPAEQGTPTPVVPGQGYGRGGTMSKPMDNIMIVGHRAVNRMILSDFVFRPKEEVPYIYMPQNRYYHLQIDPYKKHFELKPYLRKG